MRRTAIVILNWNGIGWLKKFLEPVVRYSADDDTEIYVADNCSSDGSVDWIKINFGNVRTISLDKNLGFAGGYNRALEQIEATYYVLLNSDMEVTRGWLKPLVDYMDRNPDVASCQPKIRSFNKREYFEHAGAAGGYIDKYGYTFCRGRIFDHIEKDSGQYDNITDIFWSTGACMIVRSECWFKCGGLDEDFFAHMEEVDLCWRFHHSGYRVSYIPGPVVYHVGGGSLPYESTSKTYLNFRNSLYLLYKNLPDRRLHRILFIRKVLDGLAALLFLVSGKPGHSLAVLRAHMDYYRNLKALKMKRVSAIKTVKGNSSGLMVNKSIVFWFYIKGAKIFTELQIQNG
jgi:GT2 family glycosyltransferase